MLKIYTKTNKIILISLFLNIIRAFKISKNDIFKIQHKDILSKIFFYKLNNSIYKLFSIFKYEIIRSHLDFSLVFKNYISRSMLEFLRVFTFYINPRDTDFDYLTSLHFTLSEEFLGSYSYLAIGSEFALIKVLRKMPYISRIMRLEVFHNIFQLFTVTKFNIYCFCRDIRNLHFRRKVKVIFKLFFKK